MAVQSGDVLKRIVYLIKNKKDKVLDFIQRRGGVIKKTDSDIKIGRELTRVLKKGEPEGLAEFQAILNDNASGFDIPILSDVLSAVTAGKQQRTAEQQSQDAITLALINAGIERDKKPVVNTTTLVIAILGVVLIIVALIIYFKYKGK